MEFECIQVGEPWQTGMIQLGYWEDWAEMCVCPRERVCANVAVCM